jgi:hypothetical protein
MAVFGLSGPVAEGLPWCAQRQQADLYSSSHANFGVIISIRDHVFGTVARADLLNLTKAKESILV